jgi:hypothetical protein
VSRRRTLSLLPLLLGMVAPPSLAATSGKPPFMKFLQALPPDPEVTPCSDAECMPYEGKLPDALLRLWREVGRGSFGGGLFFLVDPAAWQQTLSDWLLGRTEDRYLIGRSAFGDLFYYRDLGTETIAGSETKIEDVSRIDPHRPRAEVCAWSLTGFFDAYLCAAEARAEALRKPLFEAAVKRLGRPTDDDGFYFVPALVLGGSDAPEHVEKGDIMVHLLLLFRLNSKR